MGKWVTTMSMKTYSNGTTELYASDAYNRPQMSLHDLETPDAYLRYAMDLMKTLGVAALLDAHPGARVHTPKEIAAMACDAAAAIFDEGRQRGWIVDVPSAEQVLQDSRDNGKRN